MNRLLFTNGTIVTMEKSADVYAACGVSEGRIVALGDPQSVRQVLGTGFQEIDLAGGALLPGFTDCHFHFVLSCYFRMNIDLIGLKVRSIGQLLTIMRGRAAETGPEKWLLGLRLREEDYREGRFPTLEELDRAVPDNPVVLIRYDGHSAMANSRALAAAGVTVETPDPAGGAIQRREGRLTGVLKELAMRLVLSAMPIPEVDEFRQGQRLVTRELLAVGIVGIHNIFMTDDNGPSGALGPFEIPLFKLFESELPFRHYPWVAAASVEETLKTLQENFGLQKRDGLWRGGGYKLFADGTFGSRTAWLSEPYADDPAESGFMVNPIPELREKILAAHREGLRVAIHVIGDRAVAAVVDLFLEANDRFGRKEIRHRLEHVGMISPAVVKRVRAAGLICSVQPSFVRSEGGWMHQRVGGRLQQVYAFRWLTDQGVPLCGGSDAPIEDAVPLPAIAATILRSGFTPDQALTPFEAFSLYTRQAAWASGEESSRGTISVGKKADLIVLAQNPFAVPVETIGDIPLRLTLIDGRVLHER